MKLLQELSGQGKDKDQKNDKVVIREGGTIN